MKINAKSMEVLLKREYGSAELAAEFEVSEDEIPGLINKTFNKASADAYLRRIAKNDHRKKRKNKGRETENSDPILSETESGEYESQVFQDEKGIYDEKTLDELKVLEEEQRYKTANQEVRVKETIQEYREILDAVSKKNSEIRSLVQKFIEAKQIVDELELKSLEIYERHDKELELLHQEQGILRGLQEEIRCRIRIQFFVFEDGTIEVEGPMCEEELFASWKDSMDEIMENHDEVVGDLTLKQVKQIAKLISVQYVDTYIYEFTFESDRVESAFKTLVELKEVA